MEGYSKAFRLNLLTLRFREKLTQKQAAEKIGISLATYRKYEQGTRKPDIVILGRIAQCYSVPADWLLGLIEIESQDDAKTRALIREYTGLTNASIKNLRMADGEAKEAINILLGGDYPVLYKVASAVAYIRDKYGNTPQPADDKEEEE